MRFEDDIWIRGELTSCLAREKVWQSELRTTRVEVQQYVTETLAHKRLSAEEISSMREAYRTSSSEVNEITAHGLASRSRFLVVENPVNDWKEECRLFVNNDGAMNTSMKQKRYP